MKPFLFLDIDGVLNPLQHLRNRRGDHPQLWGDEEVHLLSPYGSPFHVSLSRAMGDAINRLDCEIWWTTTWRHEAHLVGSVIGIDAPVIPFNTNGNPKHNWKRGAVEAMVGKSPRPFVWFEDDPGARGTHNDRPRRFGVPHFIHNPDPWEGLTPSTILRASNFLSEQR